MITELRANEFYRIKHLLDDDYCNLEIKSVVLGYNPGWIFVDDVDNPQTAIVWSKGIGGFYIIGETNEAFVRELGACFKNQLIPRAKTFGYKWIELSGTHDAWNIALESCFSTYNQYAKSYQRVYGYDDIQAFDMPRPPLKKGAQILEVTRELLAESYENMSFLVDNILEWWENVEAFFQKGIGYVIIYDGKVVTTCVTSFMSHDTMESHIETDEHYRKNGFAKCAVDAFIRGCKERGISTYWDCMDTNVGSYTLAKYFGYTIKFTYPLYSFKI